jgi:signal transduction histidine kinase
MDARQEDLTAANTQIAELISDLRVVSHRLYSPGLKHLGFVQVAEALCTEFSAAQHIDIEFHSDKVSKDIPEEIRLCLFRNLQEALQNIAKHSGARRGQVQLIGSPDTIELTVHDEGIGFDPKKAMAGVGLGLPSMEQRLKSVNGQVSIDSEPGRGTVIQVRVPLKSRQKAAHN